MRVIKGKLVAVSPLHVGVGVSHGGIDNPTARVMIKGEMGWEEKFYIPGSSLKGALRARFEEFARAKGIHICNIFNSECIEDEKKEEEMCPACRTFGNQKIASKVRVMNAFGINVRSSTQPGVALGRTTGAVVHGPFEIEYVAPGSSFTFEMIIRDMSKEDPRMKILDEIFTEMKNGNFQLGGKKSTGFGKVKLEVESDVEV